MKLKVAEVVLADAELKYFVNNGQQVMQRPNRLERNGVGRAKDAARGRQHERVFDGGRRNATIIKSSREETIIAMNNASGSRRSTIGVENLADVILFGNLHDGISGVSALGIAQGWPVNADGMAMMPDAAQHRLDHIPVAEKAGPFVVS